MTIALSANTPRISYTVNQGVTQTSFPVPFVFFTTSTDLNVFVDGVARTFDSSTSSTSLYTVSGGDGSTGTVTTSVTGATGGSTVVITRSIPLARTTDFPSGGAFEVAKLNTELDTLLTMIADADDENSRAIRLQDNDAAATLTIPLADDRKGKILGFNSSSGNAEAVDSITTASIAAVNTVSAGGSATASAAVSGGNIAFTLGIPTGATGATGPAGGGLAELSEDSSPQLAGNLDLVTFDIVTTSNRDLELAPDGTGHVTIKGNTNSGAIQFNCESNSHGQIVKAQPHSAGVTNELTLPAGSNQELVGASATQTLTNKTIGVSQLSGQVAIANGGTGASSLAGANIVTTNAQQTFTKAQVPSTYTAALSATSGVLDYDTYQNFIITLASGANTLAAPTTEASQIGQTGVIIFIQPSSSSAGTVSLHGDYESVGGGGLTLSSTNSAYDVVPYIIKADNSILLGTPQLAFS